jgi:toxin HigB-1
MIETFRHRGLKRLYETGEGSKIAPVVLPKVMRILSRLDEIEQPEDMNLPGYKLHKLTGDMAGFWSIFVSANWRIIFRFEEGGVLDVDFLDYH